MQDSWLSIIGSVASIGGAAWAFYQAKEAEGFAKKAESIKNEIVQHRVIVEVSQVYQESSRILKVISQVGPTCTKKSVRGLDVTSIAKSIEEYARFINEHSGHFNEKLRNAATELCCNLRTCIEELAEAEGFDSQKEAGKKIYYLIDAFMPIVKQVADDKREHVHQSE